LILYKNNPQAYRKEYLRVKKILQRYYYYYYKRVGIDKTWKDVETILKKACSKWYFHKKLYVLYTQYGQYTQVDSILNVIEASLQNPSFNTIQDDYERQRKQSFVDIQRIALEYKIFNKTNQTDSTFEFDTNDLDMLYQEALKNIPESAYARSLYYLATKDLIQTDWLIYEESMPEMRTSIQKTNKSNLVIYPNPANDYIYVEYDSKDNQKVNLVLMDIYGKIVFDKNIGNAKSRKIDISNLKNGIYLLTIESLKNKELTTKKIIINR